ncbi:thiamine-phosphate kinase [Paenarthrobacter sp. PH39-S1]|uniref:thiamine-phosphate kinase n=1 Tax=Paenarthrobacter sp. PH39-S1 TaxID=3046204 RepID=UPI0024B97396|nr:thiamine-phosphate kinase [Paenarthrobacter sp. PH39-S1]MDJ0356578.1 thiamine-phosphate kinase [Paenarthrobacter sp. PH39-S1]
MTLTVGELSESGLLARIFPRLDRSASVLLGPGDDAAVVAAPDGRVVVSIDTLVQDRDFRLRWANGYASTGYDVGWKAAAQNLSDINAMGAVATSLVVSLTLPAATPVSWAEGVAEGLNAAIRELGATDCSVAGGDLSGGSEIVVTVAVMGTLQGRNPVLRSGARAGDTVALAGTVGHAAAGWAVLESTVPTVPPVPSAPPVPPAPPVPAADAGLATDAGLAAVVGLFCRPRPPLAAGPAAVRAGATAMLDVSDGLTRDAGRLAGASGVSLDLDPSALQRLAAPLAGTAALLGADPLDWVLGGGEDHGLLCTFPAGVTLPDGFTAIGSVMPGAVSTPPVTIAGSAADAVGWDHFAV